jgi:YHS domain-containing protein
MYRKKLRLIVIAGAMLAPAISNASSERTAFDSCVSAFEANIAAAGAGASKYKVLYRGNRYSGSVSQYFSSQYTYDLFARNPLTGAVLAHAQCTSDGRGAVASLSPLPLEVKAPALVDLE